MTRLGFPMTHGCVGERVKHLQEQKQSKQLNETGEVAGVALASAASADVITAWSGCGDHAASKMGRGEEDQNKGWFHEEAVCT